MNNHVEDKQFQMRLSAQALSEALQQKFAPTDEQAEIIEAEPSPLLVVAGAGAGKTETMAARVVWLVANGYCTPSQVLGLTFTRKAAQQLASRIRARLRSLAGTKEIRDLDPSGRLRELVESESPTVLTYDAYAGHLIKEYGLLLPIEPESRLLQGTESFQLIGKVLDDYPKKIVSQASRSELIKRIWDLGNEMDGHLVSADELRTENNQFLETLSGVQIPTTGIKKHQALLDSAVKAAEERDELIDLVLAVRQELDERRLTFFGRQMQAAARLAAECPLVSKSERGRFKAVMLDEYQDTSHAQRVLLSNLFAGRDEKTGEVTAVTAVGDPMQAIYGWRGATANNLLCFTSDFAVDGVPAAKKELVRSWRNPSLVLELANKVSDQLLGVDEAERPVRPLEARPGAGQGDVQFCWFKSAEHEIAYVADYMASRYHEKKQKGEAFTGAVLLTKNKYSRAMEVALAQRGIPFETGSLGSLLKIPEVADVVAIAKMLVDPSADHDTLRILAGPHVGLGLKDIMALARRAKNLTRQSEPGTEEIGSETTEIQDEEQPGIAALHKEIQELLKKEGQESFHLVDALADLGGNDPFGPEGRQRFSNEGYKRLTQFAAELRYLRTHSLSRPLPELFADIQRVIGIRVEAASRLQDPSGTVHLDRLQEEVENYVRGADTLGEQASLGGLLGYFQVADDFNEVLEPGEASVHSDRVQILTAFKAKGLEWDTVAVMRGIKPAWTERNTYTWLKHAAMLPTHLRGDSIVPEGLAESIKAYPTIPLDGLVGEGAGKVLADREIALKEAAKQYRDEELQRLFYVAMTRTENSLLMTGSSLQDGAVYGEISTDPIDPYKPFYDLKTALEKEHPECIGPWDELTDAPPIPEGFAIEGTFPSLNPTDGVLAGAATVRSMLDESANTKALPDADSSSELAGLWEQEVNALIEEHLNNQRDTLEVPLIDELTASDMVALKANPDDFTRRLIRPVPFKPNRYAKRGTAFHLWLEQRFAGDIPLFDEDEILGMGEGDMEPEKLEQLKENYLASPWAQRTPEYVEHPFEVRIGRNVMRGRIDAIFRDEETGGWLVLDWKTGRVPEGAQMAAAEYQLAVYAAAWKEWINDGAPIRAAFHYVAKDYTHYVNDVPTKEDLVDFLHNTVIGKPRTLVDEETPEPEAEEN